MYRDVKYKIKKCLRDPNPQQCQTHASAKIKAFHLAGPCMPLQQLSNKMILLIVDNFKIRGFNKRISSTYPKINGEQSKSPPA